MIGCIVGATVDAPGFFRAWMCSFLFWLDAPLARVTLVLVHDLTGGEWIATARPALNAAIATIPLLRWPESWRLSVCTRSIAGRIPYPVSATLLCQRQCISAALFRLSRAMEPARCLCDNCQGGCGPVAQVDLMVMHRGEREYGNRCFCAISPEDSVCFKRLFFCSTRERSFIRSCSVIGSRPTDPGPTSRRSVTSIHFLGAATIVGAG
jgi:hypothetical protein